MYTIKETNLLLNRTEIKEGKVKLDSFPPSIVLEDTSKCNLSCIMCRQSKDRIEGKNLSSEVLDKVIKVLPYIHDINLTGPGESLSHPEFIKLVRLIRRYGVYTICYSNGTMIDDRLAKRLVYNRFGMLILSVDGATKETFEGIRRGANFDKVMDNIRRINHYKNLFNIGRPILRFNFTAMRRNIEELPMLVDLAAELEVQEITIGYLIANYKELWEESLYFHKELSDRIMAEAQEKGEKIGVMVKPPRLFREGEVEVMGKKRCISPWNYTYIDLNGEIKPCCYHPSLGNLFKNDFLTIWNNKKFQELRERVNSENPPLTCKTCRQPSMMNPNDIKTHLPGISTEEAREIEERLGYEGGP